VYASSRGYQLLRTAAAAQRPPSPSDGRLQGYDPRWPRVFAAEQRRIRAALGSLAAAVEHVGSSSVPGLWGRPEIDILVGVADSADVDASTRLLTRLGYLVHDRAARQSDSWRVLVRPAQVPFELLVVEHRSPLWNRMVYLRDYLRDPARALTYVRLKARWAAQHGAGTPGYQQAKREFWANVEVPTDRR
jgi:GrpB-like predicted nucleotidyltransferase (UPF0157 family)